MAINLAKGQKISLKKENGSDLTSFCVGANWGAIEKSGFFGKKKEAVDLDLSIGIFDNSKNLSDGVYFGNLQSAGVRHSGDDLTGDVDGDDGLDNEVVEVNLTQVPENIDQIVFVLNSFKGQDFATIPFASIRLYEGAPDRVNEVVATYNIASDSKFSGFVSMILGKLYRRNGEWKFSAIGEPTKDKKLEHTLKTVAERFL
jgi:tellurium resistance protein TerZ